MIEVEVKVIGMYAGQFITVSEKLSLKDGAGPKDAIKALYISGAIDKIVYKQIKSFRPPNFIVINDQKLELGKNKFVLNDRDSLSVMQLAAGG